MNTNSSSPLAGSNVYVPGHGRRTDSALGGLLNKDFGTGTHLKFDHIAAYMQQITVQKVVS
jgi:hypothetical protein